MKKKRSIFSKLFVLLLIIILCVSISGIAWGIFTLPKYAERDFGPAVSSLSTTQRISYAVRLYLNRDDLLRPAGSFGEKVSFEIAMGESVISIADRLEDNGIIRSGEAFRWFLIYSGQDMSIQAGQYQLDPALNAIEISQKLQDATPEEVTLRILPGWRLEEIAEALPTSGIEFDPDQFVRTVEAPDLGWGADYLQEGQSLEGFLFPGTYTVKRDIPLNEFLKLTIALFEEQITADLLAGFEAQGLTLYEAVTLASIVEREAVVQEEQPMIASVFLNRLNVGMMLESDPTVQYAVGYDSEESTWWKNPLNFNDLEINSGYNTYRINGLPPGPICNPGLTALQSVAYPAQTPYYYFRAKCDGSGQHEFSKTYEEHLKNACP